MGETRREKVKGFLVELVIFSNESDRKQEGKK